MKLLVEIAGKDVGLDDDLRYDEPYTLRRAARAVLFNAEGEIAYQHVSRDGFYKLPGGGIDSGETIEEGLRREIREEVGCEIKIGDEVGMIVEYRNEFDTIQFSYVYFAEVDGDIGEPTLEQEEIDEGMVSMWITIEDAMERLRASSTDIYRAKFIVRREIAILEEVMRLLEKRIHV